MRDIFRSGDTGRCGLALIIFFFVSIAVLLGQEHPAAPAAVGVQAATTPPPAEVTPPVPMPDAAKAQDATPVQAAPEKPADAPVPPPVATQPPAPIQPPANGKAPAKKGKGPLDHSGGSPAFTGTEVKPYEIGPEDVLYLNVMHVPEVTGALSVRPDGFVTVQFAGEIKAAGLTTKELSEIVTQKLTTFYNHPEINIQVVKINSKKYYLSGEVKKAGAFTLATPKTVLEALIEGGGPADFAKTKKIYILRGQQKIPFNYNDVSKGKHLEQNILLQNGDIVVVP